MAFSLPRAKKALGQNFLQDKNIAHKIVDALGIEPADNVLEIGPGPGALTSIIAEKPYNRLMLVEKDDDLAAKHAASFYSAKAPFVSFAEGLAFLDKARQAVVNTDALLLPWEALQGGGWKIIGNLPYNIASPLMWDIVSKSGMKRCVFMVQKEVAERLAAKPATSAYGGLSVWIQSFATVEIVCIVPPQVFYPKPKVHSAVVVMNPVPQEAFSFDQEKLSTVIKKSFQLRRKQLKTIFRDVKGIDNILKSIDILPEQRPETLSPSQFHLLQKVIFINEGD